MILEIIYRKYFLVICHDLSDVFKKLVHCLQNKGFTFNILVAITKFEMTAYYATFQLFCCSIPCNRATSLCFAAPNES